MRTSENIANIAAALVKAQAECVAVTKDKTGKIESRTGRSYEYNYADFASVVEIIKPALAAHGLAMIQWSERHDDGITIITRIQHDSGEWQETDTFIPVAVVSAQAVGSALTYGKRYGAQACMFMASADDDAKLATDNAPAPKPKHVSEAPGFAMKAPASVGFATHDKLLGENGKEPPPKEKRELSETERDLLRSHAKQMLKTMEAGGDIKTYYETQRFDDEQKEALWLYMAPAVRAALKPKIPPSDLASQP